MEKQFKKQSLPYSQTPFNKLNKFNVFFFQLNLNSIQVIFQVTNFSLQLFKSDFTVMI